ncbi:glycosyltransferase [Microbulbifer rhizosphaerae]|uniref:GT2 family glycosyltransferase n=1 Tax=Microbulbifer rhizosphaerae TaxID=1562603 RepID=A0A7W4WCT6_9GAMM|nr:glycosyltransferase family 2 protein [Microbulbifer rhizosphaerae]MBB3061891.1 GT2 family glycosyltransferase [Microbulbifer rhizosphaerae]
MGSKIRFFSREEKHSKETGPKQAVKAWVDVCGIIGGKHLLIQGWAFHPGYEDVHFNVAYAAGDEAVGGGKTGKLPVDLLRTTRQDVNRHFSHEDGGCWGFSLLVDWPYEQSPEENALQLTAEIERTQLLLALKPFVELAGADIFGHSASWRSDERAQLIAQLYRSMGNGVYEIPGLKRLEEGQLRGLLNWHWEEALSIPGSGVFLSGWLLDGQQELASMVLRTADSGYSKNLLEHSVRYRRTDVLEAFPGKASSDYQAGLYAWIPMPHLAERAGLELVMLTREGALGILPVPQNNVRDDITLASQKMLVNFHISDRQYREIMRDHVGAALSTLWKYRRALLSEPEGEVLQFGPAVENPKRSVIVPLYGRYDFLLHQVAQFIGDKDFAETELIYVLDDPRLYDEFIPFCRDTSKLFPISFKIVYGGYNLGYAGANNLGARNASSKKLVLLNSDIIPSEPGWLSRIEEKMAGLENVGVAAPKLVFDDGTVQHLGMAFERNPQFGNLWLNEHPGKGTPEWLLEVPAVSEHPAVTGACMFIDKALYDSVGGLDETYVFGDFEDSDLCLKLRRAGYRHYVLGDEKLYHLERQSQNLFVNQDWKFKITLYNAWQHTQRWGRLIEQLVA